MRLYRDSSGCPDHGPLNGSTKCRFCDFTVFMPAADLPSSRGSGGFSGRVVPNYDAAPFSLSLAENFYEVIRDGLE